MYTSTVYCVSGVRLDMRHSKLLSSVSLQSAGALSELLIRRRGEISCLQASSSCCQELLTGANHLNCELFDWGRLCLVYIRT